MNYQTIISATDLAENIDIPDWLILDCRGCALCEAESSQQFVTSHIPNAYYLTLNDCFLTNIDILSFDSKSPSFESSQIMNTLKNHGHSDKSQIIIYDDDSSKFTDVLWLHLRSIGLKNVAVLQGGFSKWVEQNMPLVKPRDMKEKPKL